MQANNLLFAAKLITPKEQTHTPLTGKKIPGIQKSAYERLQTALDDIPGTEGWTVSLNTTYRVDHYGIGNVGDRKDGFTVQDSQGKTIVHGQTDSYLSYGTQPGPELSRSFVNWVVQSVQNKAREAGFYN